MEHHFLVNIRNDEILAYGYYIELNMYPEIHPTAELWRITQSLGDDPKYMYMVNDDFLEHRIYNGDLPNDFLDNFGKYCFNYTDGLYINPDWMPAPPTQEEINAQNAAALSYLAIMTGVDLSDV